MEKFTTPLIIILAVGLIAVSLGAVFSNIESQPDQRETLRVQGQSQVTVSPDEAELYISVSTLDADSEASQSENRRISNDVIAALKKAGVSSGDIETQSYNMYEDYRWEDGSSEKIGFRTNHVIKVTSDEVEDAGVLVDAAVEAGATGVNNVQFTLSDELREEKTQEAIELAASKARSKAEGLVQPLGLSLGKIVSVSESNFDYRPYPIYAMAEDSAVRGGGATDLSPKDVTISGTVSVVYEIG